MCVIIYAENGHKSISEKTLNHCWKANHDGAGIAWKDGETWSMRKGIMDYGSFLQAKEVMPNDVPCIIHFRIATSGKITPEATHGFMLDKPFSKELYESGVKILFHNGIVGNGNTEYSDTQLLCRELNTLPCLERSALLEEKGESNRFAFINETGNVELYGEWIDIEGVKFSNLNHSFSSYDIDEKEYFNDYETDVSEFIPDYTPLSDVVLEFNVSRSTLFRMIADKKIESFILRIGNKKIRMISHESLYSKFIMPFKL